MKRYFNNFEKAVQQHKQDGGWLVRTTSYEWVVCSEFDDANGTLRDHFRSPDYGHFYFLTCVEASVILHAYPHNERSGFVLGVWPDGPLDNDGYLALTYRSYASVRRLLKTTKENT